MRVRRNYFKFALSANWASWSLGGFTQRALCNVIRTVRTIVVWESDHCATVKCETLRCNWGLVSVSQASDEGCEHVSPLRDAATPACFIALAFSFRLIRSQVRT
ncbi:hypothetical protein BDZ91DRAFT_716388 [Kalaharituber pfeilii]|nr:hypothetical protein BDZ91DRAFT_716388 [Kalaharituber pfeilii]